MEYFLGAVIGSFLTFVGMKLLGFKRGPKASGSGGGRSDGGAGRPV